MRDAARPPQSIRLRPAVPADISVLYSIHRDAYRELVTKTWGEWNEAWQAANFRVNFNYSIRQVIECDDAVVGYFDVVRHSDHIWLGEIVVAPEFQRRGIGAHLLQGLLTESRRTACVLKLKVLKANHAVDWYKRLGFFVTGETDTHFMMQFENQGAVIRSAVESDVPAILALIRELAAYEHLTHACVATEGLLREHLFGAERVAEALVTEVSGGVVGYAVYFTTFSTFLGKPGIFLEDIYVQPAQRRKGIGKALLREVAQVAVRRGYGRVEWSVLDWNVPSIEFYKALGAVALDEWTMMRLTGEALGKFAGQGDRG